MIIRKSMLKYMLQDIITTKKSLNNKKNDVVAVQYSTVCTRARYRVDLVMSYMST